MVHEQLLNLLKRLRFNGMLSHFDEIIATADLKKLSTLELLQLCLETELGYRQTRSLQYRLTLSTLPQIKTLETFDCSEMPFKKEQLQALTHCQFVANKQNILLIGGSGTGKTHIALAVAYAAIQNLFRVKFYRFADLARHLVQAKEQRLEANLLLRLQRFQVLVIDEMGYSPIDTGAGSLLFELFSRLYEKSSLIISTHLTFDEWAPLFGSSKSSKAIIDRVTHHCTLLETGNISWRLKEASLNKS